MPIFSTSRPLHSLRKLRAFWQRGLSALNETRGAEMVEWIGWTAMVIIALGALWAVYLTRTPDLARTMECEVAEWIAEWNGQSTAGCDGVGSVASAPAGPGAGEVLPPLPTLPPELAEPLPPPPPDALGDEDYLEEDLPEGRPIDPKTGEGYEQAPDDPELEDELCEDQSIWGAMRQVWQGAVVDGLWEDAKGIWELLGDIVNLFRGEQHREATVEKYGTIFAELHGLAKDEGIAMIGTVVEAALEVPISHWNNGCYAAAISYGLYQLSDILIPAKGATKATKIAQIAKILDRIEDLTPDELATLVRSLERMTPDELAEAGLTAEKLRERGLSDDALRALGLICSFTPDTPVLTGTGLVPIVDIKVGDLVLAYHEGLGANAFYPVEALLAHEDPVVIELTIDGELVETTPEHPFFVEGAGWVPAGELLLGDRVRSADGAGVVEALVSVASPQVMYNLTVAEAHTFYVGDGQWLVHNACPLTTEARDALRAAAREIWQERTGRPAIWDGMHVHHRIPLEWAHLFPDADPNRIANLIGMQPADHTLVTNAWNDWRRSLDGRTPTPAEVMEQAIRIDEQFGNLMTFIP